MRKVLVIFLLPLYMTACTSGSSDSTAAAGKDSVTAPAPAVNLPYTAIYSSDFTPGKATDVATVLDNYKAWETNDMKAFRATLGDSLEVIFSDGTIMSGTSDSLTKMGAKYRDSLSKVVLTLYAWTSNHSVDKNEDWVNVWYKEVDYHKSGKVDSTSYEDANRLKDGKIVWISSHEQKLKKK